MVAAPLSGGGSQKQGGSLSGGSSPNGGSARVAAAPRGGGSPSGGTPPSGDGHVQRDSPCYGSLPILSGLFLFTKLISQKSCKKQIPTFQQAGILSRGKSDVIMLTVDTLSDLNGGNRTTYFLHTRSGITTISTLDGFFRKKSLLNLSYVGNKHNINWRTGIELRPRRA